MMCKYTKLRHIEAMMHVPVAATRVPCVHNIDLHGVAHQVTLQ